MFLTFSGQPLPRVVDLVIVFVTFRGCPAPGGGFGGHFLAFSGAPQPRAVDLVIFLLTFSGLPRPRVVDLVYVC